MVAFELVKERGTHLPDAEAAKRVTGSALGEGLIILSCGYYGNTVRLLPPLTMLANNWTKGWTCCTKPSVSCDGERRLY
jgi:4-aminobutyrate aminotransferase-like enzyme